MESLPYFRLLTRIVSQSPLSHNQLRKFVILCTLEFCFCPFHIRRPEPFDSPFPGDSERQWAKFVNVFQIRDRGDYR